MHPRRPAPRLYPYHPAHRRAPFGHHPLDHPSHGSRRLAGAFPSYLEAEPGVIKAVCYRVPLGYPP